MTTTSQFADMTSSSVFFWRCFVSFVKFSYCSWFMSSFMFQVLCQYHQWFWSYNNVLLQGLTKNSEIEIPLSEFCQISGDWGESGITNLARVFLMKCYWMLQNAKVTAFFVSKLLSENEIPPRLGLKLGNIRKISKLHRMIA